MTKVPRLLIKEQSLLSETSVFVSFCFRPWWCCRHSLCLPWFHFLAYIESIMLGVYPFKTLLGGSRYALCIINHRDRESSVRCDVMWSKSYQSGCGIVIPWRQTKASALKYLTQIPLCNSRIDALNHYFCIQVS